MITNFDLCTVQSKNNPSVYFVDFKLGRIVLSKHLDIETNVGVLSVNDIYAKQLLLKEPSEFTSERIPLYVCGCCADLGCGALTVEVEEIEEGIIWRDFGWEGLDSDNYSQSDYMARTGPFIFDKNQYKNVLHPYTIKRESG